MAELLITLAIIGVVAAMTIPTLVQNYQKKSYVSALQKSYANLTNGFRLMAATEGVDYLGQTKFWKDLEFEVSNHATDDSIVESINKNLSKYFKITDAGIIGEEGKLQGYKLFHLGDAGGSGDFTGEPYFQLQDGSLYVITGALEGHTGAMLDLSIDINETNGPNRIGRDLFAIVVEDTSRGGKTKTMQVLSIGSEYKYSEYPRDVQDCGEIGSKDIPNEATGLLCLDRIIEEGWQMNY